MAAGYYIPAEWHPHQMTIMGFPPTKTWWGEGVKAIREECACIANTLSEFEQVMMLVCSEDEAVAKKLLSTDIDIRVVPIDDLWLRDTGPLTMIDAQGNRKAIGFQFDGWGNKCPHENDKGIKGQLAKMIGLPYIDVDFVLEGGAISVDGEGTLITTEQCLLNKDRNSQVNQEYVELLLAKILGIKKIIWLDKGLVPDDYTDGHVDGICNFVGPGKIILHTIDDVNDPNYLICQDARQRLRNETDALGRKFEIIEIPLLAEKLSHVNFYIANGCVLVPTTGCSEEDDRPLAILREVLAPRKVIGINSNKLAEGGGGIHCITMQVPSI